MDYVPELSGLRTRKIPESELYQSIQSLRETLASSYLFVREARYLNSAYSTPEMLNVLHVSRQLAILEGLYDNLASQP